MELLGDSPEQMGSGIRGVFEAVMCAGAKRRTAGQMQRSWWSGAASAPLGAPGHGRGCAGSTTGDSGTWLMWDQAYTCFLCVLNKTEQHTRFSREFLSSRAAQGHHRCGTGVFQGHVNMNTNCSIVRCTSQGQLLPVSSRS